jgi:hypothetical protein
VNKSIHSIFLPNPWEDTILLKFVYGQLHNGNLAKLYGHASTEECPLCHKPDSCTHIVGECPSHKALTINRHNAACKLIHEAIREAAKGGAALHSLSDLVLVTANTGSQPHTTLASIETLLSTTPAEDPGDMGDTNTPRDWMEPFPSTEETRRIRDTDVPLNPKP